jgi:sterol desaturase/sphingolipid hydroxylase (fatty acid hydroxylase superfamily)
MVADPPFDPVMIATPFFMVAMVIEMALLKQRGLRGYQVRDTAVSLILGAGSVVSGTVFAFIILAMDGVLHPISLPAIRSSPYAYVFCFIVDDFCTYWGHRAGHRIRWAWADHCNHHSSQHYNLSTALRLGWGQYFQPGILSLVPMVLAGFPLSMITFVHGFNLVYQFFLHTELIRRLPRWIEFVFNTPSHHRVHHGTNPRYLDANFGGVLIIWDRMFGTFVEELEQEPPIFGIIGGLSTFNPLSAVCHEWFDMARDVYSAKNLASAARLLLGPPA